LRYNVFNTGQQLQLAPLWQKAYCENLCANKKHADEFFYNLLTQSTTTITGAASKSLNPHCVLEITLHLHLCVFLRYLQNIANQHVNTIKSTSIQQINPLNTGKGFAQKAS